MMKAYMQFGSIKGDVTMQGYEGWIELHSVEFASGRSGSSPTPTTERDFGVPEAFPFRVSKTFDSASQGLFEQANGGFGSDICSVHIISENNLKTEFKLINAVVSQYSFSGVGNCLPHETIEISYTAFEMSQTTKDGAINSTGYDFVAGKML